MTAKPTESQSSNSLAGSGRQVGSLHGISVHDSGTVVTFRRAWARPLRLLVLVCADLTVLLLVGCASSWLSSLLLGQSIAESGWRLAAAVPFFILVYAISGLYPGFGLGGVETIRRFALGTSGVVVILAASGYPIAMTKAGPLVLLFAWSCCLAGLPLGRYGVLSLLHSCRWWCDPVVILGGGPLARETLQSLKHSKTLGFQPVALLLGPGEEPLTGTENELLIGSLEEVGEMADLGVDTAFLIEQGDDSSGAVLEELRESFQHVVLIRDFGESPVEGVTVRNLGRMLGIEFQNQLLRARSQVLKRCLDLTVSSVVLLITAPLIGLCLLLVKLVSPGPSLYHQVREGLGGVSLKIWKIRTMHPDAERILEEYLANDAEAREQWQARFKLRRDPRVLPVIGRLLRRFSLDELPQLWQVVLGQLSLVGPRPLPDYHLRRFSEKGRRLRRGVRPGVTGLWQIMERGSIEEQEMYDGFYIRNWSTWLDVYIIARTVLTVVRGREAC